MQLGISTACFYPQPIEEAIKRTISLGFHTIEVFFNTESEYDISFLDQLKELTEQSGIQINSIHPYTSLMEGMLLFSAYSRRTQDGFAQYRKYMQAAAYLGAKYLTFHGERFMGEDTLFEHMERAYDVYHQLCEMADETGITLTQENVAWCKSRDPRYLALLAEHVPELRYTLDIKQGNRAGQHWSSYLEIMQERLYNVHINDYDATHSCLLPGDGCMDYAQLFKALETIHYDGKMLIEVYSSNFTDDAQIAQSAAFLQEKIHCTM